MRRTKNSPKIEKETVFLKSHSELIVYQFLKDPKGCVGYIFVSLFCKSEGEPFRNKEKCFLFDSASSF